MPARSAPRNKSPIDAVPKRQAGAPTGRLELPPDIAVFKHPGSVGSRDSCLNRGGCSNPRELHCRSSRTQASIGIEGSPFAQMCGVSKRLPDLFGGMPQLANENQCPLLSFFSYLRAGSRAGCVLIAIGHFLFLALGLVGVDWSMRSRWRSRAST